MTLVRKWFTPNSTIGVLTFGKFECFTLEDFRRKPGELKVWGETAIPAGRYKVIVNYSQRFKKLMSQLLDVPNFDGIRIHKGNTKANTSGCILVGVERLPDEIRKSTEAYAELFPLIQGAVEKGLWINITEELPKPEEV